MTLGSVVFGLGIGAILAGSGWETIQPLVSSDGVPASVKTWKLGGVCVSVVGLALLVYEQLYQ
jgi:hypothetical protein